MCNRAACLENNPSIFETYNQLPKFDYDKFYNKNMFITSFLTIPLLIMPIVWYIHYFKAKSCL